MKDLVIEFTEEIIKSSQEIPYSFHELPDERENFVEFMEDPMIGDIDSEQGDSLIEFSEEDPMSSMEEQERIPGSDFVINKVQDKVETPKETTWEGDRDVTKFMDYIRKAYPSGIPRHNGESIIGCERAINYLNDLNKQISEALRTDKNHVLDPILLEKIRVNMMNDMMLLKRRMMELKNQLRDRFDKKKAEEEAEQVKNADFSKAASTPVIQLVMTPFERAIAGIIVNSVVSAGHPFEDVFEYLKKKYDFDQREELSIIQLIMDMGFPIFKDRGTISEILSEKNEEETDEKNQGIDFMKNYFA